MQALRTIQPRRRGSFDPITSDRIQLSHLKEFHSVGVRFNLSGLFKPYFHGWFARSDSIKASRGYISSLSSSPFPQTSLFVLSTTRSPILCSRLSHVWSAKFKTKLNFYAFKTCVYSWLFWVTNGLHIFSFLVILQISYLVPYYG